MEEKGFLDDTSLSKTPKSPRDTSTVRRPTSNRSENFFEKRLAAQGIDASFNPRNASLQALNEVTNIPQSSLLQQRFKHLSEVSLADDANSSLGILHNFSDATDMSLPASSFLKNERWQNAEDSKLCENKLESKIEEALSTDISGVEDIDGSDRNSSPDIEYDGTNIPELNLEYNPFSAFQAPTTPAPKNTSSVSKLPIMEEESFFKHFEAIKSDSATYEYPKRSLEISNAVAGNEESRMIRNSLFETFNPAYDSIFKTLMPTGSVSDDHKVSTLSQVMSACSFMDGNSSELQAILQNQSLAEQNFLKNLQRLSETSSVKFSPDEISARSTSFRSPSPPNINDCSEASPLSNEGVSTENKNECKAMLNNEDSKEVVSHGSACVNDINDLSTSEQQTVENQSFDPDSLEFSGQAHTLDESFECDLYYKDTSRFISSNEIEQNQFEVSDSDFITKDEALEIFNKDEEEYKEEHKFEIGDNSKESVTSVFSVFSENKVTPPSWFLEFNNGQTENLERHISIGTLISARTENLGRLSEDSQRERPFFGTFVSTPVRGTIEESSVLSDIKQTFDTTKEQGLGNASMTNSADFQNITQGNEQSTLRSVFDQESEIIGGRLLSRLLSEASTSEPLELANRILTAAKLNSGKSKCIEQKTTNSYNASSSTLTRDIDSGLQDLTVSTSNEQNVFLPNVTSCGSADSTCTTKAFEKDPKPCKCAHCLYRQQKTCCPNVRPPSSCSSSCQNATPFYNALQGPYGCMAYSSSQEPYHQNLHPSHGTMPYLGNYLLGGQFQNSCATNTLPTQMLSIAIPQSIAQGPLSGFSSTALTMLGAATHSYPAVQGPNELCVPQKICVGDTQSVTLTVQNMHTLQYFFHISCISAFINEEPVPTEMAGIDFPIMFPRNMSNMTNIQLTLTPKYEGKTVVVLQIVPCLNPSDITMSAIGNSSLKTRIQYESVRPSISISSHERNNLNLGPVITGSKVLEQISITNNCEAAVPICLSLSNDIKDNRISFRINEIKLRNLSSSAQCKVLSPKTILFRLPASNNKGTTSPQEIPIIFEAGNDNCDLNFTLTAYIQTATFSEPLGFLSILATVGKAELVPADATQNHLLLSSETGSVCKQNLTVKNQSSFPVVYDLMTIGDDSISFSVSPTTLNLQPLQSFTLTVSFSPTSTRVVKADLQAAAHPHGKISTIIELIGSCKSISSAPKTSVKAPSNVISKLPCKDVKKVNYNSSNVIECNKRCLSWGGVDIESSAIKTFNIRNSSNKSLKVKLFIKEKSQSSFKIIDENNEPTTNLILELVSKEQKSVSVAFTPTRIAPSTGLLAIKPIVETDQKIFSMPLAGHGGTGKLKVSEVYQKEGVGNCLDITVSREQRTVFSNINVQNIGLRPVFVKIVVTSENPDRERITINPSEFILLENDSKALIASCTIENFSMLNATDFGLITFLYGDEIVRQQLRRSAAENSTQSRTVFQGVNFDIPFVGEERVPYDSTYIRGVNISSLFSSSLKKYVVHVNITEQDTSYSRMTFGALSVLDNTFSSTLGNSTIRRATAGFTYSPPVKDFTVDTLNRLSMPNSPVLFGQPSSSGVLLKPNSLFGPKVDENVAEKEYFSGSWTVKPELLTIDASSKDNRILLINLSKQDLKFKIECAIDVISVSPVSGIVSAKGQIGLRICIIPYSYGKLYEDYKGYIKVICGSTEKRVLITVLKEQKKIKDSSNPSENITGMEQSLDMSLEVTAAETTVVNPSSIFIKSICDFPKEIILNASKPEKVSETILVVQNDENSSVEWDIHPFSMLFTQSFEDSFNAANVLKVIPSSGILQAREKANIIIKFMPSRPDFYYRFFELSLNFSNGVKQKCNFKISGSSFCLAENTELNKSSAVAHFSTKKSKSDLYIENETCEFPITQPGKACTVFVMVKNPTMQDFKLHIIKPHLPFIVHQSSVLVRSKKFLKIPVIFKPTKTSVMEYEDVLRLQSADGREMMIKLKGVSS